MEREEIARAFWAAYSGGKVGEDGQVIGGLVLQHMAPAAKDLAQRYITTCLRKIERDGRDPVECVASAVRAFRGDLDYMRACERRDHCSPEYSRMRFQLLERVIEKRMSPREVAAVLSAARTRFSEIEDEEIKLYEHLGDGWDGWKNPAPEEYEPAAEVEQPKPAQQLELSHEEGA